MDWWASRHIYLCSRTTKRMRSNSNAVKNYLKVKEKKERKKLM